MQTIKEMVVAQLTINPNITLKDCQTVVRGLTKPNFYKIKKQWKDSLPKEYTATTRSSPVRSKQPKTSNFAGEAQYYNDDPNELLKSCCIRQLNRPDPDVRWANVLLAIMTKTNELSKITDNGADTELSRLSTSSLVSKLKEKLPIDASEETSQSSETTRKQLT